LNEVQQLATELVEAQHVRSDLLKWKVVLVAGLAATGLGLVDTTASGHTPISSSAGSRSS